MVKLEKEEKIKKYLKMYNTIIWTIVIIGGIFFGMQAKNVHSPEELQSIVNEKCDNNLTLPKETGYQVKFQHNSILNQTYCEVVWQ